MRNLSRLAILVCLSLVGCGARHLERPTDPTKVLWCPSSGEAHLSIEFGSDEVVDGEAPNPWPGSYTFSLHARGAGASGGRGSSHPRRVVTAGGERWRLTATVKLPNRPRDLSYQIGEAEGLGSQWARRYRLEPPAGGIGDTGGELSLLRMGDEEVSADAEADAP